MNSDHIAKRHGRPGSGTKIRRATGLRRAACHVMLWACLAMSAPHPVLAQTPPSAATQSAPPMAMTPAATASPVAAPASATPVEPAAPAMAALPRDLSPWGMFMAADLVVKAVMIGLAFASVLTWTILLAKGLELVAAQRRMQHANLALLQARSLAEARKLMGGNAAAEEFLEAADAEIEMSAGLIEADGIKERIVSRLDRIEAAFARRMSRGTGLLATIGATAPFVGLFGTVWGIMNSFINISHMQTTNLAVVAPGIAEALLATAFGLVAAIPAVVIYNFFSRWIAGYRMLHADASASVLRLASRDIDRSLQNVMRRHGTATAAE